MLLSRSTALTDLARCHEVTRNPEAADALQGRR